METKLMADLFIKEKDRVSIFFGMWPDKEEIESLTISGIKPEVVKAQAGEGEKIYYLWYVTDAEWIMDKLATINWSDFTYGDIIETLDIRYDKTEKE